MFTTAKLEAYAAKRKPGSARSAPRSAASAELALDSPAAPRV
jgi:hypothetical protein